MLVLSRRTGEAIVIDRQTTVRIIEIGRGRVRIGITAPKEVQVHREEVFEEIEAESRQAS